MLPPILEELPPTAWLLIGLTLFLLTVFIARGLVRARAGRTLTRREGTEVLVAAAVFAGGLWAAPAWWHGTEGSFPLELSAFTGRLLAAGATVFAFAGLITLLRPSRQRVRFLMMMVLLHLGPLTAALAIWHPGALDWTAPASWGFVLALVLLIPGALVGLLTPVGLRAAPKVRPPARGARVILLLAGLIAWGWGLALYIMPDGPRPELWLWAEAPLESRLMASSFFALAGASLVGAFAGRHSAVALFLLVVWAGGVGGAIWPAYLAGEAWPVAYAAVWGVAGVLALIQLMLGANVRFRAPDPEETPADKPAEAAAKDSAPKATPGGEGRPVPA